MKNKHLLLLFVCTLVLGVLFRNLPWIRRKIFQTELIRIPAERLRHIRVLAPGQAELTLEKNDDGWVAFEADTAIPVGDSLMSPWLEALRSVFSIRIVATRQPDTLDLLPGQSRHVEILMADGKIELMDIGRECMEGGMPATYVRIGRHEGIYLVSGHLRRLFSRRLDDFRDRSPIRFRYSMWQQVRLSRPGLDTILYERKADSFVSKDSLQPGVTVDSMSQWAALLNVCNELPVVSRFDESQEEDCRLLLRVEMDTGADGGLQWLQMLELSPALRKSVLPADTRFLLHCSERPAMYYALKDSLLLQRIRRGPAFIERD